jgi:predicted dehydrogenase
MEISRRDFVRSVTTAGAGIALANRVFAESVEPAQGVNAIDTLNVAVIGVGQQGRGALINSCLPIPGIRFKAVCDIWDRNRQVAVDYLKQYGHEPNAYVDYQEMLANEKDLDAVLVASPDWLHADHAIAAMEAGHHVYCEKEMSNSLEKAKAMVLASRRTGKLLQIGHQRRSNPRYIHAIQSLIHENHALGKVTHANAWWNRSINAAKDIGCSYTDVMPAETLAKYGYASMDVFLNWRWYKKYGGGPIVDLGSHQIDIFEWVFETAPRSVIASGGVDYHTHHEWYDNVMCIFEYDTPHGVGRAFYETLTTSSHGGNSEVFMGENGTLLISEVAARGNAVEKEKHAPDWNILVKKGLLKGEGKSIVKSSTKNTVVDARESPGLPAWPLPIELAKLPHQPHLENFFDTVRGHGTLNCPGEVGYATAVAVLAVNEAVSTNKKIEFAPSDFEV